MSFSRLQLDQDQGRRQFNSERLNATVQGLHVASLIFPFALILADTNVAL